MAMLLGSYFRLSIVIEITVCELAMVVIWKTTQTQTFFF